MTPVSQQSNESAPTQPAAREGTPACEGAQQRNGSGSTHTDPAGKGAPSPTAEQGTPPAGDAAKPSSSVDRAEVLADQLARKVAALTATVGRGLFRFGARLREEAEDVWAEAQNIRHGKKS